MARAFQRQRDGRIEVNLNHAGREYLRQEFTALRAALDDPSTAAGAVLRQPIDPSRDDDDPLRTLERDLAVSSNLELALLTVDEPYLNESEAWAWCAAVGQLLHALAAQRGVHTDADLDQADPASVDDLKAVQSLLWDLSRALS